MLGKNQPAKIDKTDYQTLPITYISLYLALLFHGHAKRLSGPHSRSWSKTTVGPHQDGYAMAGLCCCASWSPCISQSKDILQHPQYRVCERNFIHFSVIKSHSRVLYVCLTGTAHPYGYFVCASQVLQVFFPSTAGVPHRHCWCALQVLHVLYTWCWCLMACIILEILECSRTTTSNFGFWVVI